MKKLISLILVLMLCAALACPAAAEDVLLIAPAPANPVLVDDADLLTDSEEAELRETLQAICDQHQVQVAVMTVLSTDGYSADNYINYVYDTFGYGYGENHDGVLLVVDMGGRTYRILSNGLAGDAITMSDIDDIGGKIAPLLSDGDYAEAFEDFAFWCESYIDGYINGYPFDFGFHLVVALVIGFVAALIVTGIWRGQLKSVRRQTAAQAYLKQGSMRVTLSNDLFLYRNVTRTAKPKSNSSSGGSSGGSRNVGGGSF